MYRITPSGKRRFLAWLRSPSERVRYLRLELLARLYFFRALGLEGRDGLLAAQAEILARRAASIRDAMRATGDEYWRCVLDFRASEIEAAVAWIGRCASGWGGEGPEGLAELRSIVESSRIDRGTTVALVGGGGKTSALFALARSFAGSGLRALATTTTRILNPEGASEREGRGFGPVLALGDIESPDALEALRKAGGRVVLGSHIEGAKLCGHAPEALGAAAALFDLCLVEADGSRGRPIKAPNGHEPVVPAASAVVIGVIGLDAIGAPLDERVAHRPELLGPLVGCASGEAIRPEHVARLVASPQGLFKGAPGGARRVVLLNKADVAAPGTALACADAIRAAARVDAIVIGSLGAE